MYLRKCFSLILVFCFLGTVAAQATTMSPLNLILDTTPTSLNSLKFPAIQDSTQEIDIYHAAQMIDLPILLNEGHFHIQSLGLALFKRAPQTFNEELINREKQFFLFLNRHSAPLKGLDGFESFEVIEHLALDLRPISSDSESYSLLKDYAMTDYGAMTLRKILEDSNQALEKGYIEENGALTSRGKEALASHLWPGLFIFGSTQLSISAGTNSLRLPDHFKESFFPVGSEPVDRLALLNHEMGHTRFGLASRASFKALQFLERDHLMLERLTVEKYENPVRVLNALYYGKTHFKKRTVYFDNFSTIHIPSGIVFKGPAFINTTTVIPSAYLYKYSMSDGDIHIFRDSQGLGIVDYHESAQFYRLLPPSLPF